VGLISPRRGSVISWKWYMDPVTCAALQASSHIFTLYSIIHRYLLQAEYSVVSQKIVHVNSSRSIHVQNTTRKEDPRTPHVATTIAGWPTALSTKHSNLETGSSRVVRRFSTRTSLSRLSGIPSYRRFFTHRGFQVVGRLDCIVQMTEKKITLTSKQPFRTIFGSSGRTKRSIRRNTILSSPLSLGMASHLHQATRGRTPRTNLSPESTSMTMSVPSTSSSPNTWASLICVLYLAGRWVPAKLFSG
jgi:hypothetical protein